ncbi:MAG: hypothetical protein PHT51_05040 [Patescibacteria group bacterium]|nr:hypothetical protein [Patescibacteria group bacterium]MDD4610707.1 hypothetical protein [Patescibacteria group bacterium]
MKKTYQLLSIFFIFSFLFFVLSSSAEAAGKTCSIAGDGVTSSRARSNLSNYIKYFYNRYSKNFDTNGLVYSSPSYGIDEFKSPRSPREWLALTSYYKYRAVNKEKKATEQLREGMVNSYKVLKNKTEHGLSFEDAEAIFLMVRTAESIPALLTSEEKKDYYNLFASYLRDGIKSRDSENRAIVAAAHWQYIANFLYVQKYISQDEKARYDRLIKNKTNAAIRNTINSDGWYMEGNKELFSAHYHTLSAFMLMTLGDLTKNDRYLKYAEKMYYNIKKMTFKNGLVEAKIGSRPIGNGPQFYLMAGMLGKYFGDDDYRVYLNYASGDRFFSDPARPDRLEFHSTIINSEPSYHDDYAFSDIAEMSLAIYKLRDINLNCKNSFFRPIKSSRDGLMNIINSGDSVVVNNRKFNLVGNGNYSELANNK